MSDEEGHVFTGESEQDQRLRGSTRKLELLLDTAQYHLDAQAMADGAREDVYQTFNVLMRRKPKENNFKAILDSIRQLMTTPLAVPQWLHDVLLGYGDPASASYWKLPGAFSHMRPQMPQPCASPDITHKHWSFQLLFSHEPSLPTCHPCFPICHTPLFFPIYISPTHSLTHSLTLSPASFVFRLLFV